MPRKSTAGQATFRDALTQAISSLTATVTADQLIARLTACNPVRVPQQEELLAALRQDPRLLWSDSRTCCSRAAFFAGASLRLVLSADEQAARFLIPGHRFVPFTTVRPSAIVLQDPQGRPLPRTTRALSEEDAEDFFLLLGARGDAYMAEDSEANRKQLPRDQAKALGRAKLLLTVFDLSGLPAGGEWFATVVDAASGTFRLAPAPAPASTAVTGWCQAMDQALDAVLRRRAGGLDIQQQLAYAFFLGDASLRQSPPLHLGGYLARTKLVELTDFGYDLILWFTGQDVPSESDMEEILAEDDEDDEDDEDEEDEEDEE